VADLVTLIGHLQTPLTEEEKVPISQEHFNSLITDYNQADTNSDLLVEEVATLFRVSKHQTAPSVLRTLESAILWTYEPKGSESAFHSTWDINIALIMRLILVSGEIIRDSNKNTNTALKRPDYGYLINNSCLFRGEEKPSGSSDNPEKELVEKLVDFRYQPLEFILGLSVTLLPSNKFSLIYPPRVSRYWSPCQLRCNNPATHYYQATFHS
jgi:hypothetical protein